MGTTNAMGIPYPESTDAVANGATAMENLATTVDDKTGLVKVASVTFSGSAGVEVQNCFSSNFANYVVQLVYYGSAGTNTQTQYMTGTNTRDQLGTYNRFGFYWTTGVVNFNLNGATSDFGINHSTTATDTSTLEIKIYSPNLPTRTMSTSNGYSGDSGLTTFLSFNKATTSNYTGFYLFPTTGTITGKITVYGMR
jgi:hypothetical protein